jgi:L,D-transpeptidase-like protein
VIAIHRAGIRWRGALASPLVASFLAAAACPALAAAPAGSELAAAPASPTLPAAPAPGSTVPTRLSDLRTISHWAYPRSEALVHASPSPAAHALGRLQFLTGDGQAALYLALTSEQLASGQTWVRIELPARPRGLTGWVPRDALGSLHIVGGYLLVDQRRLRATLFRDRRAIFSAPIGVGKPTTVTPAGQFYVMEKLRVRATPAYGPYAIGTSAYAPTLSEWPGGGVVGIHGTDEPQLIPGRPSHGCIRMRNGDITRLWSLIAPGTPIDIT